MYEEVNESLLETIVYQSNMPSILQFTNHIWHFSDMLMLLVSVKFDGELSQFGNRSSTEFLFQSKSHLFCNLVLPKLTHHIIFHTAQQHNASNGVLLFL
jgi:hypothetical protein